MGRTKVVVVGLGNVGRGAADAVAASPDFELSAIVRRQAPQGDVAHGSTWEAPIVTSVEQAKGAAAAMVCLPSRLCHGAEVELLRKGISTVDSFDIHGEALLVHRDTLASAAREGNSVAVIGAGWDPGADSMVRCLMEAMAPAGVTYTNFGPGMSMGHSVAARSVAGVADAVSVTLPAGLGIHKRAVYVQLDGTRPFESVCADITSDPYFIHDDTKVIHVDSTASVRDTGHGVTMYRTGTSGSTGNQQMEWKLRIVNPAATGQMMLSSLRAGLRQKPGAYTVAELPPAHMLPGNVCDVVRRLV